MFIIVVDSLKYIRFIDITTSYNVKISGPNARLVNSHIVLLSTICNIIAQNNNNILFNPLD